MMRAIKASITVAVSLLVAAIFPLSTVQAQSTAPPPDFSFNSFAGTYNLERDSKGIATLNVQEDMVVVFPVDGNLYGIQRSIPENYQGHNLNLKIISLTDVAGNPINYTTHSDGQGNEVVVTGDPDITLSGIQTYRLQYQTSGVVSVNQNNDEFLVDVNGRGWKETFGSVKAFINVDKSFAANLIGKPSCYVGDQNEAFNTCTIQTKGQAGGDLITAATTQSLGSYQALVVKMDFKKGTFNQKKPASRAYLVALAGLAVICFGSGVWSSFRYHKLTKSRR